MRTEHRNQKNSSCMIRGCSVSAVINESYYRVSVEETHSKHCLVLLCRLWLVPDSISQSTHFVWSFQLRYEFSLVTVCPNVSCLQLRCCCNYFNSHNTLFMETGFRTSARTCDCYWHWGDLWLLLLPGAAEFSCCLFSRSLSGVTASETNRDTASAPSVVSWQTINQPVGLWYWRSLCSTQKHHFTYFYIKYETQALNTEGEILHVHLI